MTDLAALQLQVRELQLQQRVGGEFEVASSVASAEPTPSPSTSAAVAAGTDLSPFGVAAAQEICAWIQRGLRQQHRGLSGREKIDLASKLYALVKDISGQVFDPPKGV